MIKCKNCSKEMSKKDSVCSSCGAKRNWFIRHKILTGIGAFILLITIFPSNKPPESKNTIAINSSKPTTNVVQTEMPKIAVITTIAPTEKPSIPREYLSALAKAESYSEIMHMSKKGLYSQLISESGEKFSKEAAQYAIDNIKTNWKEHALAKAKLYQDTMNMSPSSIKQQLTSSAGEKFTQEEADYAIENLPK